MAWLMRDRRTQSLLTLSGWMSTKSLSPSSLHSLPPLTTKLKRKHLAGRASSTVRLANGAGLIALIGVIRMDQRHNRSLMNRFARFRGAMPKPMLAGQGSACRQKLNGSTRRVEVWQERNMGGVMN